MQPTKATRILKTLFAGYTEPAALSHQHSQKLLDGLKSSFRDKLDQEYGRSPSVAPGTPARKPTTTTTDGSVDSCRQSATNQHLKSLLSNPLFSYQSQHAQQFPPSQPSAVVGRDPMDVFDHAVSMGMMNFKAATGIMLVKRRQLEALSNGSSSLPDSDTARRVVRWMRSSRPSINLDFLDNKPFMTELMPFLLSENLEHLIWEWIARTLDPPSGTITAQQQHQRASFLLQDLVRLRTQPQDKDLDAAIMTLVQARESLKTSPILPHLLLQPWRSISYLSTVESYSHKTPPTPIYNAHVKTALALDVPVKVESAHLSLLHPTRPDSAPAVRLFKNAEALRNLVQGVGSWKFTPRQQHGHVPWLVVLANDTINYLAKSGRGQEAEEVARLFSSAIDTSSITQ